ncbi:MAG: hypothetical protein IKU86_05155 [Thermoguttaceae bacterium]|nr:hypothetical protein [Thermoguttaceae bacterium]
MNDRDYRTVVKMVEYCDDVASFLNEFSDDFEAYCADVRTRYACDMCVIQIWRTGRATFRRVEG